jgi:hypothetical protein
VNAGVLALRAAAAATLLAVVRATGAVAAPSLPPIASLKSSPPPPAIPWVRTPAVPERVLLGLLSTSADSDVVSPAGIDAVLCALVPVMSERARRQRRAASESECRPNPDFIARSIWFNQALRVEPGAAALLRRQAELHFEPGPVNAGIARWLRAHDALPVPLRRELGFAAVSALDFARGWEYPFTYVEAQPFVFHGRKRDARVKFLSGRQFASVGDRSCVRGVIPVNGGGAVFVTDALAQPVAAAIRCLSRELDPKTLVNAHFFIPQLDLRRTGSIAERLRRLGLTDIFEARSQPFPKLFRNRKIDAAFQAAQLTMDWKGIRVRATTIFGVTLAGPQFEAVLAYDRPFALRVVDQRGATVAVAIVNDLPSRR